MSMVLGGGGALLRAEPISRKHPRQFLNVVGFGPGLGAPLAVKHNVPDDADKPDAMVADLVEPVAVAQHAQECLLHGVFSIRGIAHHGKGYAVERRSILLDQGRERFVLRVPAGFLLPRAVRASSPKR